MRAAWWLGFLDSEMPCLGPRGRCKEGPTLPPTLGMGPGVGQVVLVHRHVPWASATGPGLTHTASAAGPRRGEAGF